MNARTARGLAGVVQVLGLLLLPGLTGNRVLAAPNLLAGKAPVRAAGVQAAARLTDGKAALEGDAWNTDATAVFKDASAHVVFDLGAATPVAAAWLQGDNNDRYLVEVSADGTSFQPLWVGEPVDLPGMRARHASGLGGAGRYVRIQASGGDGAFSIGEVQLFAQTPAVFPPAISRNQGSSATQAARDRILVFGLALIVALALAYRGAAIWWTLLVLAWPAWAGISAWLAIHQASPIDPRTVSLARATWALVAALALLREYFPPARWQPDRRVTLGVLGLMAGLSFLSFYNLGQPQFFDNRRQQSTFIHYPDLRQYYTTAKYFREIGYGDTFLADLAAYREEPGVDLTAMQALPVRDLDTFRMTTLGEQVDRLDGVRARFSQQRWQAFRDDARYFREVMGVSQYLETMQDMGANATPVWMAIAALTFQALPPGHGAFLALAALDVVLLLFTFMMIGRCFGLRTALVCVVLFGANDFIMYGTNWAGSFLRHDWLAYLGLGACALKRQRFALGGVLLAASAMIRAFPAVALVGAALPMLWWIGEQWHLRRRPPALGEILAQHRATVRIVVGAAGAVLGLFLFAAAVLPVQAWAGWLVKLGQLASDPHPSCLSLISLIAGWEYNQVRILRDRLPVFIAGLAFFIGLLVLAARGRRPEQAAMLGLVLIPVVFYPSTYYIHFIFLLPLVATSLSATAIGVWVVLLLLCALQYGAVMVLPNLPIHFYLSGVLMFAALAAVLLLLAREQVLAAGWFRPRHHPGASAG